MCYRIKSLHIRKKCSDVYLAILSSANFSRRIKACCLPESYQKVLKVHSNTKIAKEFRFRSSSSFVRRQGRTLLEVKRSKISSHILSNSFSWMAKRFSKAFRASSLDFNVSSHFFSASQSWFRAAVTVSPDELSLRFDASVYFTTVGCSSKSSMEGRFCSCNFFSFHGYVCGQNIVTSFTKPAGTRAVVNVETTRGRPCSSMFGIGGGGCSLSTMTTTTDKNNHRDKVTQLATPLLAAQPGIQPFTQASHFHSLVFGSSCLVNYLSTEQYVFGNFNLPQLSTCMRWFDSDHRKIESVFAKTFRCRSWMRVRPVYRRWMVVAGRTSRTAGTRATRHLTSRYMIRNSSAPENK